MVSRKRAILRARATALGVAAGALATVACSGRASTPSVDEAANSDDVVLRADSPERSVCPQCPSVPAGGESSDFGGDPHPCEGVERTNLIDADTAARLGFDMPTLVARIERDFDEPLRWTPENGARAEGYQPETRVEGRARIVSYSHVSLDPAACQGTSCQINGAEVECSDRLELVVEAELRTRDGAVDATAVGYAFQGRPGFSFESPAGTVFADLRDVRGSLQLFPPARRAIARAVLSTDLLYGAERIEGYLHTYFLLGSSTSGTTFYHPFSGHWPLREE